MRFDWGLKSNELGSSPPLLIFLFVLLVLVLTRLTGVIMMIVIMRGWLLGRDRMEPSMRIATDKRQGK